MLRLVGGAARERDFHLSILDIYALLLKNQVGFVLYVIGFCFVFVKCVVANCISMFDESPVQCLI